MYHFNQKLKSLEGKTKKQNKEEFINIFSNKNILKQRLEYIQVQGMMEGYSPDLREDEAHTMAQLVEREK